MANPVAIAVRGKGYAALMNRIRAISDRYGFTHAKMDDALTLFTEVLQKHGAGATFPITAVALARNGPVVAKYQAKNIEFAIHGLYHIDYSKLRLTEQEAHLERAKQIFQRKNVKLSGFRCPYLRWNVETLQSLERTALKYDSSQALYWDVAGPHATEEYRRVLEFYRAKSACNYPALPAFRENTLQIPYCVPDDEAIIDRMKLSDEQDMVGIWLSILKQTYELGELFTLGLHPERINLLHRVLDATLAHARSLSPEVWIAQLDQITDWWLARYETVFSVAPRGDNRYRLSISGPRGITVLARLVAVDAPAHKWADGFERISSLEFEFQADKRPCIGLSRNAHPDLTRFLKQQGYWVERVSTDQESSIYIDRDEFTPEDERPLLKELTANPAPLIRCAQWPNGAKSAMCVTGDIDAITLWDYGLRFIGK